LRSTFFSFLNTPWRNGSAWERLNSTGFALVFRKCGSKSGLPRVVIAVFLAVILSQALCYTFLGRTRDTFEIANRIGFGLWAVFGLWLGGMHFRSAWRVRHEPLNWPNRPKWSIAWLIVPLVAGNGLNPWIGLKTQTCFSMYSNLRSEAFGNHLFLKRVDLFGYQKDLVELVESEPDLLDPTDSPTRLQHFANRGRIFPYFELRRLVSGHKGDFRAVYRRHGQQEGVARMGELVTGDEHLFEPIPVLLAKFLWFRRYETFTGPMYCTHLIGSCDFALETGPFAAIIRHAFTLERNGGRRLFR